MEMLRVLMAVEESLVMSGMLLKLPESAFDDFGRLAQVHHCANENPCAGDRVEYAEMGPRDDQSANPAFVMHGTGLGEEAEDAEGVIDAQIGAFVLSRVDAQQVALRSLKQDDLMTAHGRRNLRLNSSSVIAVLGSRS